MPSEFVLANQEYFGLQFSLSFGHPNIFWRSSSPFDLPFGTWYTAILCPVYPQAEVKSGFLKGLLPHALTKCKSDTLLFEKQQAKILGNIKQPTKF